MAKSKIATISFPKPKVVKLQMPKPFILPKLQSPRVKIKVPKF